MMKINLNCLFPVAALIILIYTLSNQLFDVPPLGKILNPFIGVIQNDQDKYLNDNYLKENNLGLSDSVSVFFDQAKVPHIYAKNIEDLYFSQGYVTAILRLWQMDFTSYVSAGRLSEIFNGENYLQYDRNQRRMGMLEAAKRSLFLIEKNPETKKILSAYTRGVNAYIKRLNYRTLPFEYKFLNYTPEPWSNLKSVLIMKLMGNTLSGYEKDMDMSRLMLILGEKKFNLLYPDFHSNITPMVDYSKRKPRSVFNAAKRPAYLNFSFISSISSKPKVLFNRKLGSNSWVISGKKTKSGLPILASDPHLNFALPCVWLQMQLSAPGLDVYGVSIPGTPSIIIGFNKNIAWGITNGADDVKDWYKLQVNGDYKTYKLGDKMVKLDSRIEEIKRKGQKSFFDTIYSSKHGPIVNDNRFFSQRELIDYAMKWELATPSNEFLTFIHINKAKNYREYKESLKYFSCPIQNFTFACNDGTIAVNHQGNMAIKYNSQGRFILDGSTDSSLNTKYIPLDSLPQQVNPKCNYLVSANQHPTDSNYPYYYNGYYSENRANQISKMLAEESKFDINKVEKIQLDNTNSFAVVALPIILKKIDKSNLNANQKHLYDLMKSWDCSYNFNSEIPKMFEWWWSNIKNLTWDELTKYPFPLVNPDDYILLNLIETDPTNIFFDKLNTSKKEIASNIIFEAFIKASNDYFKLKNKGNVKWGNLNRVNFLHLTKIPAFSKLNIPCAGYPEAINAISNSWGPSWRMVVQLGNVPTAYGIYPGGQSGNVGSKYYDNFINDWGHGKYYHLNFYPSIGEARAGAKNTLLLK
ncbi:penicillin acylase family protein [Mucilaginibacter sp. RCC_168]|uniref:penicillin acylase family protein n=1 Tax=Mucilaginibacter sp. RCC_168 TaxID=3239221 RepID=UPI0035263C90